MTTQRDGSHLPIGYQYDEAGRVLTYRDSEGYWEEYTYDEAGRELSYRDSRGYWYEYTYDEAGRVLSYRGGDTDGEWFYAIAHDVEYDLFRSEAGLYLAGCRGPWTAEQALQHWGGMSYARAVLFTATIKQAEGLA